MEPKALQIVFGTLVLIGGCDGMHLETAWIERPPEVPNDATFAGRIPPFKHDQRTLGSTEVRLLNELEHTLQRNQAPLVICEVQFRMVIQFREPRSAPDNEIARIRGGMDRQHRRMALALIHDQAHLSS